MILYSVIYFVLITVVMSNEEKVNMRGVAKIKEENREDDQVLHALLEVDQEFTFPDESLLTRRALRYPADMEWEEGVIIKDGYKEQMPKDYYKKYKKYKKYNKYEKKYKKKYKKDKKDKKKSSSSSSSTSKSSSTESSSTETTESSTGSEDVVLLRLNTTASIIASQPEFSTLLGLVIAADLFGALDDKTTSVTVFCPTNSAFEKIPNDALVTFIANEELLSDTLLYHVVSGKYLEEDLEEGDKLPTLLSRSLIDVTNTEPIILNDEANITMANMLASNGVVHAIDSVLSLPSYGVSAEAETLNVAEKAVP